MRWPATRASNCAASTTGPSGEAKATRDRGPRAGCAACGSVFASCRSSAGRPGRPRGTGAVSGGSPPLFYR